MFRRSALEMRVVILAPIGRDAALLASTINALNVEASIAPDAETLLKEPFGRARMRHPGGESTGHTVIEGLSHACTHSHPGLIFRSSF